MSSQSAAGGIAAAARSITRIQLAVETVEMTIHRLHIPSQFASFWTLKGPSDRFSTMGKSKSSTKSASKLAKKAKQEEKAAKSELKAIKGKGKEENLEDILAQFQEDWKTKHAVKEEVQLAAPSRRLNATFTAYGDHLWLIGGEYFDGDKAYL